MSKELAVIPERAIAAGISPETWNSLANSIFPGAQEQSIILAFQYCKARQLDVLKKPVHIVPMSVKIASTGKYETRDVIMPGINELRVTASRTNLMAGTDAPVFSEKTDVQVGTKPLPVISVPESCSITVWRLDKNGVRQPYTHVEFFEEAVARTRDGIINSMWQKRPRGQVAKCAEAGALRKAFPEELGGVHAAEEMMGRDDAEIVGDEIVITQTGKPNPDDIPDPQAKTDKAVPAKEPAKEPEKQPAQETKPHPDPDPVNTAKDKAKTEGATAGYAVQTPTTEALKVDLPEPALKVLNAKLTNAGLTIDDLLKGMRVNISIATVNEAFTWIKANAKAGS